MFFAAKSVECSNLSHHQRPQNRFGNFNDWYSICHHSAALPQQQTQGAKKLIFSIIHIFIEINFIYWEYNLVLKKYGFFFVKYTAKLSVVKLNMIDVI